MTRRMPRALAVLLEMVAEQKKAADHRSFNGTNEEARRAASAKLEVLLEAIRRIGEATR